jgi:hypothetical protein
MCFEFIVICAVGVCIGYAIRWWRLKGDSTE